MRLEWTIMTTRGPAVGGVDVDSRDAACDAMREAVRDAFKETYTTEHSVAVRSLCAHLRAAELPFAYRVPAVAVTLET